MRTFLSAMALASVTSLAACATNGRGPDGPRGRVLDASSGRSLAGVQVVLDADHRLATDDRGRFWIPATVPSGVRPALIIFRECRSVEAEITVPDPGGGDVGDVRITPPPDPRVLAAPAPPDDSPGRVVSAAEIEAMGVSRMTEVLRRVAPEMVGGASGDPGRGAELRGRGSPSGSGERTPVVVVDGVVLNARTTARLDDIAPSDVAWMEVLPGAVAGWEYGTGGSGGVLRIQTKRGTSEGDTAPEDCPLPADWLGVS